jgi:hypothetical protein
VRALIAIVIVGCGGTAPPPEAPKAVPIAGGGAGCDPAWWQEAARSTQRAWLASGTMAPVHHRELPVPGVEHALVAVVESDGEDVLVASVTRGLIVARWAPVTALAPVVIAEAAVSARSGGVPDPAVRVLPGYPLELDGGRISGEVEGMTIAGSVAAADRTRIFDARPELHVRMFGLAGPIHAEPRADAPVRATIGKQVRFEVGARHGEWVAITARTPYATVEGFILPPPPPPPQPPSDSAEIDMTDDRPKLPGGACLYDFPGGRVVGMTLDLLPFEDRKLAATPGWSRIALPTRWGTVAYHTNEQPIEVPPPTDWSAQPAWPREAW